MKLPLWFLISFIVFCFLQWTVGVWIELVTNNARDALLVIVVISFILYPIFTFCSIISFRKNKILSITSKRIGVALLLIGFITNPAVFQVFKQIL